MKVLLDTQTWLWMQASPDSLHAPSIELVENPHNELLLSAASSWEIAVKYAIGRLDLPAPPGEYVPDRIRTSGVTPLPVEHSHALHVSTLPLHHTDPFDRLLIAQAQMLRCGILTGDHQFAAYDVEVHWAQGPP